MDIGVGVDANWGCAAVQRAGDSAYTGFIVIEHAVIVPFFPGTATLFALHAGPTSVILRPWLALLAPPPQPSVTC